MRGNQKNYKVLAVTAVIILLLTAAIFITVNVMSRKSKTEKYLQSKYGEEFIVIEDRTTIAGDHVGKYGVPFAPTYWAVCSPESDRDIYFSFHTDLGFDDCYDNYYTALLDYELSQMLQSSLENYFGQCIAVGEFTGLFNPDFENSDDANIEKLLAGDYDKSVRFTLAVNADNYITSDYEEEYNVLTKALEELEQLGLKGSLIIYFLPEEGYKDFAEIFRYKHDTGAASEREELRDKYERIYIFNDENGLTALNNYIKQREALR